MRQDTITIGDKIFLRSGHTYVCGILNLTPDSFSDGGKWNGRDRALRRAGEMIAEGADFLDIGGESTRPGCAPISAEEEITRVIPIVQAIKSEFNVPISLDTYKSEVARAGIAAGVDMINDIRGLQYDPAMAELIAGSGLPCCLMHNRREPVYEDLMRDVAADLEESVRIAAAAGIDEDKIILDPGVGFGKTYGQNLELIRNLEQLKTLGYPLLLGCSRKSVIGLALDLPVEERLEGTLVTTVLAVLKGCNFIRVHDVKENVRAVRMAEVILHG